MKKYNRYGILLGFLLVILFAVKALAGDDIYSNPEVAKGIKQYAEIYLGNETSGLPGMGGMGSSFTLANIIAWFLFGSIGFLAFNYGRKMSAWRPLVLGIVLMVYPYFVSNTIVLYIVGAILCAAIYFWAAE